METFYTIIRSNPEYFVWAFGIVNVLWSAFVFFNKQSHQKELAKMAHSHSLELERKKKVFQIKADEFQKYYNLVDDFSKKQIVDIPRRMQPIFKEYFDNYLKAENQGDKEASRAAIVKFGDQVNTLLFEGIEAHLTIKAATNSLKLVATDLLVETFERLECLYGESFELSQAFMKEFVSLITVNDQNGIAAFQSQMQEKGKDLQNALEKLMMQMRQELKEI